MRPTTNPGSPLLSSEADWEAQALLPARLLVGAEPEVQAKLRKAGKYLYLLILEGLGSEPTGSTLALELQTLLGELRIVQRHLQEAEDLEPIAEALDGLLADAEEQLNTLGLSISEGFAAADQDPGVRPFILSLSGHPDFQTAIRTVGEGFASLQRPVDPARWRAALLADLRWVIRVLRQHIATRPEISSLHPGECCLCSLAGFLARGLVRPVRDLERVLQDRWGLDPGDLDS